MNITKYDYKDKENLAVIKNTVAQNTTDAEFSLFIELCKSTGLNPFKKEIWCIVTGAGTQYRKCQIMVGLGGYFQIANTHPEFDGVDYKYGPLKKVPLIENSDRKKDIEVHEWIEALVYRKDRSRPQAHRAYWDEVHQDLVTHNKKLGIWAKRAKYMHGKVAESHALKRAFAQELNGLYSEAEMPEEYEQVASELIEEKQYETAPKKSDSLRDENGKKIYKVKGKTEAEIVPDEVEDESFVEEENEDFSEDELVHKYDILELLEQEDRAEQVIQFIEKCSKTCRVDLVDGYMLNSSKPIAKFKNYEIKN